MPDKDSVAVLKFIAARTQVKIDVSNPPPELSRIKDLENTIFYLLAGKYISEVNPCIFQTGNEPYTSVSEYKIEPLGKMAVEQAHSIRISDIKSWIAIAISIASLIKSFLG